MALRLPEDKFRNGRTNGKNPGILLIENKLEFLFNKTNKAKTAFYYYCKFRKTKGVLCQAKATVIKYEGGEEEETTVMLKSCSVTTDHSHPGGLPEAISEGMKIEMCRQVQVGRTKL